jgi:hypothetical protein
MFFLRDTVTNNDYHIDIIIKRFGKEHVKQCVSNGIYKIALPDDIKETLLLNKFNKKSIQTALGSLRRGHFMENLVKQTGKVKKGTMSFNEYVTNSPYRQQFMNKLIIQWLYRKFKRAYRSRLSKIETNIDMITCEEIKTPVIISEDWKNGNKVVYEYYTILNCAEYVKIPVGFDFEEDGRETIYYVEKPTGYFVSPYTRFKFKADSIKRLYY